MRNYIAVSFLFVIIIISSCNKDKLVRISGTIEKGGGKMILIKEEPFSKKGIIDSVKIKKNGYFSFKVKNEKTVFLRLIHENKSIIIIAQPGDEIALNAFSVNFDSGYVVEGSDESKKINLLNDRYLQLLKSVDSLQLVMDSGAVSKDSIISIIEQIETAYKEHKKFLMNFILSDLSSLSNIIALFQQRADKSFFFNTTRDIQFYKIVNDSLYKKYPDNPYVENLNVTTQKLVSEVQLRKILSDNEKVSVGIPNIILPDITGKLVSLNSLKEKYILLLFGSLQNKETLAYSHQLKPLYNTYKNEGFEIYQVSFEKNIERWKKYVNFEELPWTNVCDTSITKSKLLYLYNITDIPSSFLLDLNNESILGKNLSMRQLDIKLNYLINN